MTETVIAAGAAVVEEVEAVPPRTHTAP